MNRIRRAIEAFVVAVLLYGCATSKAALPATGSPSAKLSPAVVVYLLGFFNNENAQRFEPSPIDYSPMIDPDRFYSSLTGRLAEKGVALVPPDEFRVNEKPDEATVRQYQLSLYNTLVVLRVFLLGLPEPPGFKGAPMPGLVTVESDSSEWHAKGLTYVVVGLETTVGETGTGHVLRSGLAVLRLRPDGSYESVAFGTYDFTNIDAEKLSELVSDLVVYLQQRGVGSSELPLFDWPNKPLQPTRAALPNGLQESPGSGPRG